MKVVHCMQEKYDVYIGRPGKWGNPFSYKKDTRAKYIVSTRQEAVYNYKKYVLSKPELLRDLSELKGKVLGCWCATKGPLTIDDKPFICHGQVLLQLLEDNSE